MKKEDYSRRDFFDIWMPELAPPAELVSWALSQPFTPSRWSRYSRAYRTEMRKPPAARLIKLLAVLSRQTNFSVGCYCEDETSCHRSLLRELLAEAGADIRSVPDQRA